MIDAFKNGPLADVEERIRELRQDVADRGGDVTVQTIIRIFIELLANNPDVDVMQYVVTNGTIRPDRPGVNIGPLEMSARSKLMDTVCRRNSNPDIIDFLGNKGFSFHGDNQDGDPLFLFERACASQIYPDVVEKIFQKVVSEETIMGETESMTALRLLEERSLVDGMKPLTRALRGNPAPEVIMRIVSLYPENRRLEEYRYVKKYLDDNGDNNLIGENEANLMTQVKAVLDTLERPSVVDTLETAKTEDGGAMKNSGPGLFGWILLCVFVVIFFCMLVTLFFFFRM
jgi:hypothetical protein